MYVDHSCSACYNTAFTVIGSNGYRQLEQRVGGAYQRSSICITGQSSIYSFYTRCPRSFTQKWKSVYTLYFKSNYPQKTKNSSTVEYFTRTIWLLFGNFIPYIHYCILQMLTNPQHTNTMTKCMFIVLFLSSVCCKFCLWKYTFCGMSIPKTIQISCVQTRQLSMFDCTVAFDVSSVPLFQIMIEATEFVIKTNTCHLRKFNYSQKIYHFLLFIYLIMEQKAQCILFMLHRFQIFVRAQCPPPRPKFKTACSQKSAYDLKLNTVCSCLSKILPVNCLDLKRARERESERQKESVI